MTSETGAEFVERMKREWDGDNVPCVEDFDQLINLARRGAAVQWRPIEEAPKDGTRVDLWTVYTCTGTCVGHREVWCWWEDGRWLHETTSDGLIQPVEYEEQKWDGSDAHMVATHFMPLPPPPAGETNE